MRKSKNIYLFVKVKIYFGFQLELKLVICPGIFKDKQDFIPMPAEQI